MAIKVAYVGILKHDFCYEHTFFWLGQSQRAKLLLGPKRNTIVTLIWKKCLKQWNNEENPISIKSLITNSKQFTSWESKMKNEILNES